MTTERKNSNAEIRCRFAPSPTGELHVGGARTALFNYLFAKSQGGTYVLRVEDTDRERSTEQATEGIFNGLSWLGLTADEGPYFQSERLELYQDYARKLLRLGAAYRCYCSADQLNQMREQQTAAGEKPRYNHHHRPENAPNQAASGQIHADPQSDQLPEGTEEKPYVIRLRLPLDGITEFEDMVLGTITTANSELDDYIIIRSDGSPTYNFCVVVDDLDMRITHVIRGNDHVSNTPKQVAVYNALGEQLPLFAHVPMILGADKKKLSKRHGATSVFEYRKDGYLPAAFNNCLARLSWSHGDQEIFTPQELEQNFSLDHVGKSAAVFDIEKLRWINSEHIKLSPATELAKLVIDYLPQESLEKFPDNGQSLCGDKSFLALVAGLKERCATLVEMAGQCQWFLIDDKSFQAITKSSLPELKDTVREATQAFNQQLKVLQPFEAAALETSFKQLLADQKLGFGKLAQPFRLALTGESGGLPLFEIMQILGRERTTNRLSALLGSD